MESALSLLGWRAAGNRARRTGISQSQISKRLKLLDLPPATRTLLAQRRITIEKALRLARASSGTTQRRGTPGDNGLRFEVTPPDRDACTACRLPAPANPRSAVRLTPLATFVRSAKVS